MSALRIRGATGGTPPRPQSFYLDAGREYIRLYGADQLTAAAFSPASARRNGRPELADRYLKGRPYPDGSWPATGEPKNPWPSLNGIKGAFDGSFVTFRKALGLKPNSTLPAGGRRKPGEAEPILTERIHRVVVHDAGPEVERLRKELAAQTRRADRAVERLEAEKAREPERVEVRVENREKVRELRERLADEAARRRGVERALRQAEKREESLRTRKPRVQTRTQTRTVRVEVNDPTALAEIQRLTDRLARVHERAEDLRRERDAALEAREEALEHGRSLRREAVDKAAVDRRVRAAEREVNEIKGRLADMAVLVTGIRRALTPAEIRVLRRDGPAGAGPYLAAAKRVLRAAGSGAKRDLAEALTLSQEAAQAWKDRL